MYTVLPRILCVDDEPNVLDAMARNLRRHFDVTTACGGEEGLDRVEREGPFAVVISDQRMPGMDGVTFLSRVRETNPDTVRILLTGYADTAAAMGAVNRGAVFRFLGKPIETPLLHHTLNDAVAHHRLVTSERVLLQRTLHGSIKAILDVLAVVNPSAFGRAGRAKEIISTMASAVRAEEAWQIEIAAMISQVGAVAQDHGSMLSTGTPANLSQVESTTVGQLSRIAADMVANIPRMEEIHAMLVHQELRFDGANGGAGAPRGGSIPLGARMLKIAFDLDALQQEGHTRERAVALMRARAGSYDPDLLNVLSPAISFEVAAPPRPSAPEMEVEVRMLEVGMRLSEDLATRGGRILIARNEPVTEEQIRSVKRTLDFNELRRRIRVAPAQALRAGGQPMEANYPPAGDEQAGDTLAPAAPTCAQAGGMMLDLTMRLTV